VEAITFGIMTGVFFLVDKLREKRAEEEKVRAALALPEPPKFTLAQVSRFTRVEGPVRAFDPDVAEGVLRHLASRSVIPVTSDPFLAQMGKVWRVVPLTNGLPSALDVVTAGHAEKDRGAVVLGSLSLVLLASGSLAPMVIVVGSPNSQILAVREDANQPGGKFAVLRAATATATAPIVTPPPETPAAVDTTAPTPFPPPPAVSPEQAAELGRIVGALRAHEKAAPIISPPSEVELAARRAQVQNGIKKDDEALIAEAVVVPSQE